MEDCLGSGLDTADPMAVEDAFMPQDTTTDTAASQVVPVTVVVPTTSVAPDVLSGGSGPGISSLPIIQLPVIRPNTQYGVVQPTGIIQSSRIVAPGAIVSTGPRFVGGTSGLRSSAAPSIQLPVVISAPTSQPQGVQLPVVVAATSTTASATTQIHQQQQMLIQIPQQILQPITTASGAVSQQARLVRLSAPLQLLPPTAAPLPAKTKPVKFSQKTKFVPTVPGVSATGFMPITTGTTTRLLASSAIQFVPTVGVAAATATSTKKSILIKAPTSKTANQLSPQLEAAAKTAKASTKLQPGIIRMTSPRAAPPTPITKVDAATSITPIKATVSLSSFTTQTAVAAASVSEQAAVSRRLHLPEEDPTIGKAVAKTTITGTEDDTEEVSLECEEVFDDSFEKSSDQEPTKEAATVQSSSELASESAEPLIDLLKPLPAFGTAADALRTAPLLDVRTNEFGLMEVVASSQETANAVAHDLTVKSSIPASPRKDNMARRIQDDDILYCEGCGCYGMAGEFSARNSCSSTCTALIQSRVKEKLKREREALVIKQRKEEKRGATAAPATTATTKAKKKSVEITTIFKVVETNGSGLSFPWQDNKRGFLWSKYLEWRGSKAAPLRLFPGDPLPEPHGFREGMKLEAIDPEHQSLICVVSVVEVQGHRLRLHFDGYGDSYDFWENANSENIFPARWCQHNNQRLTPPKGYGENNFDWESYLSFTKTTAATPELFLGLARAAQAPPLHGWKVGMKLEACDRQNKSLVCVASVANVIYGRILLHFDGWEMDYDYWTRPSGPNVKPVGWCAANRKQLNPPKGSHPSSFSWPEYLSATKSKPVPPWAFRSPGSSPEETQFQPEQSLEAVDIRNPRLVRVASIASVEGRQIEIRYDGWSEDFNQWMDDDSPDIHPCGWAVKTGHPLQGPLTPQEVKHWSERGGCPTPGCRGIGHIKGEKFSSHHTASACPYAPQNVESTNLLPDRLKGSERERAEIQQQLVRDTAVAAGGQLPTAVGLGRGTRKRKKRKFFDDSNAEAGHEEEEEEEEDMDKLDDITRGELNKAACPPISSRAKRSVSVDTTLPTTRTETTFKDFLIKSETGVEESWLSSKRPRCEEASCQTSPPHCYSEWEEAVRRTVWQPGYVPRPEPPGTLSANWAEHSKFLLGTKDMQDRLNINKAHLWSVDQVVDFLSHIPSLEHDALESALRDQEIDGESFLLLTQADLTKLLGVRLGPAIKIYNAIIALRMSQHS